MVQHVKKCWLDVISWREVFVPLFHEKRENKFKMKEDRTIRKNKECVLYLWEYREVEWDVGYFTGLLMKLEIFG